MSSSTSSSRIIDLKLLALLVLLLVVVELGVRTQLVPRSKDLNRFRKYPKVASALLHEPGYKVALIGNSATDHGIIVDQLTKDLTAELGAPAATQKFVADASKINTWHFMVKHLFWDEDAVPDLIVVTFYERNLQDGNPMEVGRVAQYFTSPSDWPTILTEDLTTIDQRLDFLFSTEWATYAFRNRIKDRALSSIVPDYKGFTSHNNEVARHHYGVGMGATSDAGPSAVPVGAGPATYKTLDRFLAMAKSHGTKVCFLAYPTPPDGPGYVVADALVEHIHAAGQVFVDLSHQPTLLASHYEDDVHVTPEGAVIYTSLVAKAIAGPCRQ